MAIPLPDNLEHVEQLCQRLSLGDSQCEPTPVSGGFQHRMWRLETRRGRYAIKQLTAANRDSDELRRHFDLTEAVAAAFAAGGIPAVHALEASGGYVQLVDGIGYLVYPWCDAKALSREQLTGHHVSVVAGLLARMHNLDLDFPELRRHTFDIHTAENIEILVAVADDAGAPFAGTLKKCLPSFLEIVAAQDLAMERLGHRLVVSHGDLDHKNVLWDAQGAPHVIDWESARRLNPTHEGLLEALSWSGAEWRFKPRIFDLFVAAYQRAGGIVDRADATPAYHRVLGDWVFWLMHNVGRYLEGGDASRTASLEQQIVFSLATLQRIMDHVPGFLSVENPPAVDSEHSCNV